MTDAALDNCTLTFPSETRGSLSVVWRPQGVHKGVLGDTWQNEKQRMYENDYSDFQLQNLQSTKTFSLTGIRWIEIISLCGLITFYTYSVLYMRKSKQWPEAYCLT